MVTNMVTSMLYQGRIISFEAAALCKQKEVFQMKDCGCLTI